MFSPSIFDSILKMKGLPNLPEFKHKESYRKTAGQVMRANLQDQGPSST